MCVCVFRFILIYIFFFIVLKKGTTCDNYGYASWIWKDRLTTPRPRCPLSSSSWPPSPRPKGWGSLDFFCCIPANDIMKALCPKKKTEKLEISWISWRVMFHSCPTRKMMFLDGKSRCINFEKHGIIYPSNGHMDTYGTCNQIQVSFQSTRTVPGISLLLDGEVIAPTTSTLTPETTRLELQLFKGK